MERVKPVDNAVMKWSDERGGIVKWLIGLAIFGVIAFDAGSIIYNIFSLDAAADDIAVEVTTGATFDSVNNPGILKAKAKELATDKDAKLIEFSIGTDGIVRLTLRRRAHTLVVSRISAIEDWARATGSGQASTNSN